MVKSRRKLFKQKTKTIFLGTVAVTKLYKVHVSFTVASMDCDNKRGIRRKETTETAHTNTNTNTKNNNNNNNARAATPAELRLSIRHSRKKHATNNSG